MKTINTQTVDPTALFKIGSGLYVLTSNDGNKDNGMICNTVFQVTNTPNRIAVCINKQNYSCGVILDTGILNVNILSEAAAFKVFQTFGFQSGRDVDKFTDIAFERTENGLAMLNDGINAVLSLEVEQRIDVDTHMLFICNLTAARNLSDTATMTYDYYQNNVKPKPQPQKSKGWICKICNHIVESEILPPDFICPVCGHGASDFERR